jgi:hypothetical protein
MREIPNDLVFQPVVNGENRELIRFCQNGQIFIGGREVKPDDPTFAVEFGQAMKAFVDYSFMNGSTWESFDGRVVEREDQSLDVITDDLVAHTTNRTVLLSEVLERFVGKPVRVYIKELSE